MTENQKPACPDCELDQDGLDRRAFFGATAVTLVGLQAVPSMSRVLAQDAPPAAPAARQAKPAEAMIRELFSGLSDEQKRRVVYPYDHRMGNQTLTRHRMFNSAIFADHNIGLAYTPAQRELTERILRSITSGNDDSWRAISRNGTWDGSENFDSCGAYIFGDPTGNRPFAWVFTGHHLTVRCDGNSQADTAFGGPMYYGHSPDGWSQRNVFFPQTRAAQEVYQSLNENQRRQAIATFGQNEPREQERSVQFRERHPGLVAGEMTADQRRLVQELMRAVLAPYRREDADEVMQLVQRNGGLERLHLAFYRDNPNNERWTFWRIEGPGFVWNFRVLPHVHTFVNIGRPANA
jgi:hypothetical protein